MTKILNIVNGDTVLNNMQKANIVGSFLPWGDFLHDGAVPQDLSLEELSKVRAEFISQKGLGEFDKIYQEFKDRDSMLKKFKKYTKIFLWFENDIYDQLQLIQVLDWFAKYASNNTNIYIVYPENYLVNSTPKELNSFLLYNKEFVTHNHFITARKAWGAFRSKTPYAWYKLLDDDTDRLPFLKDTVKRVLEEYPNSINGLSRTQHQILLSISKNNHNPTNIFNDCQKLEERAFIGEIIFIHILKELVELNLLNSVKNGKYMELTSLGQDILDRRENLFNITKVDRWIGGVHITNNNPWCWNIKYRKLLKCDF
ncbi:MAG TPA: hypothetical protein ENK76_04760 [Campylobacterales bacterium]|nr:hypothetical protein [Campylobacterales bacterium]